MVKVKGRDPVGFYDYKERDYLLGKHKILRNDHYWLFHVVPYETILSVSRGNRWGCKTYHVVVGHVTHAHPI